MQKNIKMNPQEFANFLTEAVIRTIRSGAITEGADGSTYGANTCDPCQSFAGADFAYQSESNMRVRCTDCEHAGRGLFRLTMDVPGYGQDTVYVRESDFDALFDGEPVEAASAYMADGEPYSATRPNCNIVLVKSSANAKMCRPELARNARMDDLNESRRNVARRPESRKARPAGAAPRRTRR